MFIKENPCLPNPCNKNGSCIAVGSLGKYYCQSTETTTTKTTTTTITTTSAAKAVIVKLKISFNKVFISDYNNISSEASLIFIDSFKSFVIRVFKYFF